MNDKFIQELQKKAEERFEQPKVFDVWSVLIGIILVVGAWLWWQVIKLILWK